MLMQSHAGEIELLPALPKAWSTGAVRGIVGRGGFELDIMWDEGTLTQSVIHSRFGGPIQLRYGDVLVTYETKAGETLTLNRKLTKG